MLWLVCAHALARKNDCSILPESFSSVMRVCACAAQAHEKKRWGRLMKAKGDLCLMAGSVQDALDHYRWGETLKHWHLASFEQT